MSDDDRRDELERRRAAFRALGLEAGPTLSVDSHLLALSMAFGVLEGAQVAARTFVDEHVIPLRCQAIELGMAPVVVDRLAAQILRARAIGFLSAALGLERHADALEADEGDAA